MPAELRLSLADAPATEALGRALARALLGLPPGALSLWLQGDLGAGKTTLTRGLLRGLGHAGRVPSPTYTLLEPYELAAGRLIHADLYRLRDPAEAEYLGLAELPGEGEWLVVEWPERGAELVAPADLAVTLAWQGTGREACCRAAGERGAALLRGLAAEIASEPL